MTDITDADASLEVVAIPIGEAGWDATADVSLSVATDSVIDVGSGQNMDAPLEMVIDSSCDLLLSWMSPPTTLGRALMTAKDVDAALAILGITISMDGGAAVDADAGAVWDGGPPSSLILDGGDPSTTEITFADGGLP